MAVKYDTSTIRTINMFESVTGVDAVHAIINEEEAFFVVPEGKAGMAIGKGGEVVKKLQNRMDKDVKIYEYSDNLGKFINNIVPTDIRGIDIDDSGEEKKVTINVSKDNKGRVVGRNGSKIDSVRQILAHTHDVDEVSVS